MTIELARRRLVEKTWGSRDLAPWDAGADDGSRIGEIWYERSVENAAATSLLLKLLFTSEQLSVQVHPDDVCAKAMGLASGKTEAWYILHAAPGAQVALGLKRALSARQLRKAAVDGSLEKLIWWRSVDAGDTVFVPAGTIHTLSAGLVIAEIQQRSDITFRLQDPVGNRELHIDQAVGAACADVAPVQPRSRRIDDERTLLVRDSHFIIERLDLPAGSERSLRADGETWLLVVEGVGRAGSFEIDPGCVVFASADSIFVKAGAQRMVCIVAYAGAERPEPELMSSATPSVGLETGRAPLLLVSASAIQPVREPQ